MRTLGCRNCWILNTSVRRQKCRAASLLRILAPSQWPAFDNLVPCRVLPGCPLFSFVLRSSFLRTFILSQSSIHSTPRLSIRISRRRHQLCNWYHDLCVALTSFALSAISARSRQASPSSQFIGTAQEGCPSPTPSQALISSYHGWSSGLIIS